MATQPHGHALGTPTCKTTSFIVTTFYKSTTMGLYMSTASGENQRRCEGHNWLITRSHVFVWEY